MCVALDSSVPSNFEAMNETHPIAKCSFREGGEKICLSMCVCVCGLHAAKTHEAGQFG